MRETQPSDTGTTVVAIAGGSSDGVLAVANSGSVQLVYPAERWRRQRGASLSPQDVPEALAAWRAHAPIPGAQAPVLVTPTPSFAGVARLIDPRDAAAGLARMFAGGPCLVLVCDPAILDGAELWRLDAAGEPRIAGYNHWLDPNRQQAAIARAAGADEMPRSQLDALARWGVASRAPTDLSFGPALQDRADALARVQEDLAAALTDLVPDDELPGTAVVLVGRVFRNTGICTSIANRVKREVIVPPDPGAAGLAVGTLAAVGAAVAPPTAFAGPTFDAHATKLILDNCKLSCDFPRDPIAQVVEALSRGRLVAWFEGGMEWGPRALGHRSILADATKPYVLENLNVFLKKRPAFMSYGLSIQASHAADVFATSRPSPWMQFESPLRSSGPLRHIIAREDQAVRYQTVTSDGSGLAGVLGQFFAATGVPFLVNTSFNAVTEPIVASPSDAVRCFFGSGIDMLFLNGFVLSK